MLPAHREIVMRSVAQLRCSRSRLRLRRECRYESSDYAKECNPGRIGAVDAETAEYFIAT